MRACTIVGAGPVGTLMALLLARRGVQVRLIERRPDPRSTILESGRSINLALAARGIVALEQAGLTAHLAPHLVAMPGRMLHDEHGGLQFLRYGQNEREVIYAISREQLNRVLIQAATGQPGVQLCFGLRCLDVDPSAGTLRLQDERSGATHSLDYDLLLAADGAGSSVRAALQARGLIQVREEPLAHDYKELQIAPTTAPATAPGVAPGGATHGAAATAPDARYVFEPHALHIWPRGGFMLIALPNTDGSFTATLFLPRVGDPGFDQLADGTAVRALFRRQFGDASAVIADLEHQFGRHPQGRLGSVYCQPWQAAGRVLLLGDAAHAIVPFHGQGLNCGFEDCVLLERLLAGGGDTAALLRQFEQQRRPDTDAIAAMALENYVEMRDGVRSPQFMQLRELAAGLERHFPERFIPRYSMVMFHPEIPYAEALRRGELQQQVLQRLSTDFGFGPLRPDALAAARTLLDRHGL